MRDRASRRVPPAVVAGRATPRVSSRPHEPTIAPPGFFFEKNERKGCVMHGSAVRRRSPVRSRAFDRDRVLPDTAFERITPRGINRARADVIAAAPRDRPPNFSPLVPVIRPVRLSTLSKTIFGRCVRSSSRPLTVHRPFTHLTGRGSRRGGSQGCRQEGAQEG